MFNIQLKTGNFFFANGRKSELKYSLKLLKFYVTLTFIKGLYQNFGVIKKNVFHKNLVGFIFHKFNKNVGWINYHLSDLCH